MIPKLIDQIQEADLLSLRDNRVPEGKTIEYKRELPGMTDAHRKEFAKDISSFANTEGGDLLYGVVEEAGVPVEFPGIGQVDQDALKLRLEEMCRAGIEPRLGHLEFRFIAIQGNTVLLVRITKSWSAPHRASAAGHGHFYGRTSAGTFALDVTQLRTAFTLSQGIADRIRDFRSERLGKIHMHHTPVPIMTGCKVVMHLVPLSAFATAELIDVAEYLDRLRQIVPFGASAPQNDKINLDGILVYTNPNNGRSRAYTQIFRNGTIEAIAVFSDQGRRHLYSTYEQYPVQSLPAYLNTLQAVGVAPPIFLFLSIVGASGYQFVVDRGAFRQDMTEGDREMIVLPEIVISAYGTPAHTLLRPAFDMVWNAFGYAHSENYDGQGHWRAV